MGSRVMQVVVGVSTSSLSLEPIMSINLIIIAKGTVLKHSFILRIYIQFHINVYNDKDV